MLAVQSSLICGVSDELVLFLPVHVFGGGCLHMAAAELQCSLNRGGALSLATSSSEESDRSSTLLLAAAEEPPAPPLILHLPKRGACLLLFVAQQGRVVCVTQFTTHWVRRGGFSSTIVELLVCVCPLAWLLTFKVNIGLPLLTVTNHQPCPTEGVTPLSGGRGEVY